MISNLATRFKLSKTCLMSILSYCIFIIIITLVKLKNNECNKRFNTYFNTFSPVNHLGKSRDDNGKQGIWTTFWLSFVFCFLIFPATPIITYHLESIFNRITSWQLTGHLYATGLRYLWYLVHVIILILSWTQRPRERILFLIKFNNNLGFWNYIYENCTNV